MNLPRTQMPAFRGKLATEQIAQLAELIYAVLPRGQRRAACAAITRICAWQ